MRMNITTWGATAINDGTNYKATIPIGIGNGMAAATPNFIDMGQGDPVLGGKTLAGTLFTFQVQLKGATDATREGQRDALASLFLPNDFTLQKLYATDEDDSDRVWYLEGFPVSPPMLAENALDLYNITLALSSPYWIESSLNTDTWVITASTETQVLTNVGNIAALPKFQITANGIKSIGTDDYKFFCGVHTTGWATGGNYPSIPLDITPSGLNTAALVTAGRLLASGDDLKVTVNGTVRKRWFGGGGINTTTTHIWTHISFSASPTMLLNDTMDNSTTPATLTVGYSDASVILPGNSCIQIGNEFITYATATVDTASKTITFASLVRGAKGSSKAAHSIGASVYWIENDIWVSYNNPSATPPDPTGQANFEPAIDLANSTNSSWIYDKFQKTADASPSVTYVPMWSGQVFRSAVSCANRPQSIRGVLCINTAKNPRLLQIRNRLHVVYQFTRLFERSIPVHDIFSLR